MASRVGIGKQVHPTAQAEAGKPMRGSIEVARGNSERKLRNDRAFDVLAQSYDKQINPLLLLEKRYVERMLPEIAGRDVVDAGCGSGRWLSYLAEKKPRSLTGIDASGAMLQAAWQKRLPGVELLRCSCEETPFPAPSVDIIRSSFVLTCITQIDRLAVETGHIAML